MRVCGSRAQVPKKPLGHVRKKACVPIAPSMSFTEKRQHPLDTCWRLASMAMERIPSPLPTRQCTRKPATGSGNCALLTRWVRDPPMTHRVHRGRKVRTPRGMDERKQEDRLASAAAASRRHHVGYDSITLFIPWGSQVTVSIPSFMA